MAFVYSFVDLETKKVLNPGEMEHQEHEEPQRTQGDKSIFAAIAVHGALGDTKKDNSIAMTARFTQGTQGPLDK